mmetsp:Transcript_27028/g.80144  ORF Transcript_27028/g.80144 Transcript_27028/m.80144 type:complete len:319 (+) Transcript_27028:271-1227(+)
MGRMVDRLLVLAILGSKKSRAIGVISLLIIWEMCARIVMPVKGSTSSHVVWRPSSHDSPSTPSLSEASQPQKCGRDTYTGGPLALAALPFIPLAIGAVMFISPVSVWKWQASTSYCRLSGEKRWKRAPSHSTSSRRTKSSARNSLGTQTGSVSSVATPGWNCVPSVPRTCSTQPFQHTACVSPPYRTVSHVCVRLYSPVWYTTSGSSRSTSSGLLALCSSSMRVCRTDPRGRRPDSRTRNGSSYPHTSSCADRVMNRPSMWPSDHLASHTAIFSSHAAYVGVNVARIVSTTPTSAMLSVVTMADVGSGWPTSPGTGTK